MESLDVNTGGVKRNADEEMTLKHCLHTGLGWLSPLTLVTPPPGATRLLNFPACAIRSARMCGRQPPLFFPGEGMVVVMVAVYTGVNFLQGFAARLLPCTRISPLEQCSTFQAYPLFSCPAYCVIPSIWQQKVLDISFISQNCEQYVTNGFVTRLSLKRLG